MYQQESSARDVWSSDHQFHSLTLPRHPKKSCRQGNNLLQHLDYNHNQTNRVRLLVQSFESQVFSAKVKSSNVRAWLWQLTEFDWQKNDQEMQFVQGVSLPCTWWLMTWSNPGHPVWMVWCYQHVMWGFLLPISWLPIAINIFLVDPSETQQLL